jgi:hypothetical protein
MTISSVPVGTRHEIQIAFPRHKTFVETVDIPKHGGAVLVNTVMEPMTGKLIIMTRPDKAQIRIDGETHGHAPMVVEGLDMATAKKLELDLEDHEPVVIDLDWPPSGQLSIDQRLLPRR